MTTKLPWLKSSNTPPPQQDINATDIYISNTENTLQEEQKVEDNQRNYKDNTKDIGYLRIEKPKAEIENENTKMVDDITNDIIKHRKNATYDINIQYTPASWDYTPEDMLDNIKNVLEQTYQKSKELDYNGIVYKNQKAYINSLNNIKNEFEKHKDSDTIKKHSIVRPLYLEIKKASDHDIDVLKNKEYSVNISKLPHCAELISPSKIGNICLRNVQYTFINAPQDEKDNTGVNYNIEGAFGEQSILQELKYCCENGETRFVVKDKDKNGYQFKFEDDIFTGRCDGILEDSNGKRVALIECKYLKDGAFDYYNKNGIKIEYIAQMQLYMKGFSLDKVLYIPRNKNTSKQIIKVISYDPNIAEKYTKLGKEIKDNTRNGILMKCTENRNDCKFCPYNTICAKDNDIINKNK